MITGNKKKIKMRLLVVAVFLFVLFGACNLKNQGTDPNRSESFSKIYDKSDDSSYTAVDIKQLPDDRGYIILGKVEKEELRPYVLRLDIEGNPLWETTYDDFFINGDSYIEPTADILVFNKNYYFFCNRIDSENYLTYIALFKLSDRDEMGYTLSEITLKSSSLKSDYFVAPMNAKEIGDTEILLFALNGSNGQIIVEKMNCDGSEIWIQDQLYFDSICASDFPLKDRRYNFIEVENIDKNYYNLHGYLPDNVDSHPYCFGITKLDPVTGSINENEIYELPLPNTPFITAEWAGKKLSGARIDNNVVSFILNSEPGGSEKEIKQLELIDTKAVCVKTIHVNKKPFVFFVGSAKNNRIVLYAYDAESNTNESTKEYFGHTHIYEASALIKTDDYGLAILGTTFVAGQLGRLCLFKRSITDLEDLVSNK